MKGYGCLPRTFSFQSAWNAVRHRDHGVSKYGIWNVPSKELFFSVACAKKPSSCRCILASEKYSAGVEVLAMWEGRRSVLHWFCFGRAPRILESVQEWFGIKNCQGDSMVHLFLAWASHWRFLGLPKFIGNSAFAITVWRMWKLRKSGMTTPRLIPGAVWCKSERT
jgi:hypothetical protein